MAPIGAVTVLRDAVTILNFVAAEGELPDVADACNALIVACEEFGQAASGSWLGYHSRVYYRGYRPPSATAFFNAKWGLNQRWASGDAGEQPTSGEWAEHTNDEVLEALSRAAGSPDQSSIRAYGRQATEAFKDARTTALSIVQAELLVRTDPFLVSAASAIQAAEPISKAELIRRELPASVESNDVEALREGIVTPPHVDLRAQIVSTLNSGLSCQSLSRQIGSIADYIEEHGSAVDDRETNNRIFVGHGTSEVWRSLHRYLVDVLGLQPPWFDQVPPEGFGAAERLRKMVDGVAAAFVVVTLEDEREGQELLRENMLHEIGMFQGRIGVNRAFVLLEEGCEGFANVYGVAQISFPQGRIEASFADIRRVLERAEII